MTLILLLLFHSIKIPQCCGFPIWCHIVFFLIFSSPLTKMQTQMMSLMSTFVKRSTYFNTAAETFCGITNQLVMAVCFVCISRL